MPASVTTSTSLTLAPGVKNVTATGKASVTLVGNELDNVMTGNSGKNTHQGRCRKRRDQRRLRQRQAVWQHGQGRVHLQLQARHLQLDRTVNLDTISDFSVKDDSLQLDNAVFKKLGKVGKLSKDYFTIGEQAKDKNDYIVYDKKTGILSYDADGSGSGKAVEFAKLAKNLKLTSADFFTI